MARAAKKKRGVPVKELKLHHDPMIRFYDKTQDWLQEKGRPVVIGLGVLAGLILVYTAGYYFFNYRESKAAVAFAEASQKFKAPVGEAAAANPSAKSYADEKTKWQETAEAFERVAADYPGYYAAMARAYAGVAYLHFDVDKGIQLLQQAADRNDQPASDIARQALAEHYATNGETDKAVQLYERLLQSTAISKDAVQLALGHLYEKTGDTEKAVAAYVEVAGADRSSPAGSDAEKRLSAIAPDRLKDLPPPSGLPQF